MEYLDEFLDSARGHPYVLGDTQSAPRDPVHAVCLKRPCLLSASLPGSSSLRSHQVKTAKDLLHVASSSPKAAELLEHALSHAVDADPRTYFESKHGLSFADAVLNSD